MFPPWTKRGASRARRQLRRARSRSLCARSQTLLGEEVETRRPGPARQNPRGGQAMKAIDGDSHLMEPMDLFERYIDPAFREPTIRMLRDPESRKAPMLADGNPL